MSTLPPIPEHLAHFPWYAPHLAWLRTQGLTPRHDPGDAEPRPANLRWADPNGADLSRADLRGADLPEGFPTIPTIPNIDAAILAAVEHPGNSLDMDDWHTCETTHCRAGWAIHLTGEAGRTLESRFGPSVAGALIYAASRPDMAVPDFLASNEEALEDLRKCAAEQEHYHE